MSISASMVKELRERTGAGMMECKKALVETGGDLEAAAELLRKSGQAKADKKSGRVAADGRVVIKADAGKAVMVEMNSETDFVAKDENFIAFAEAVAGAALATGTTDVEAFADEKLADGRTVEQARTELIAKVGENISVRRIATVTSTARSAITRTARKSVPRSRSRAATRTWRATSQCMSLRATRSASTRAACRRRRWNVSGASIPNRQRNPASRQRSSRRWCPVGSPSSSRKSRWSDSRSSRIRTSASASCWARRARR